MSHGTRMNESWHTYESVMAHIRMSHGTHMNESWHAHTRRSHGTHITVICRRHDTRSQFESLQKSAAEPLRVIKHECGGEAA